MSLRTLTDIKLPVGTSETELIKLAEKKLGKKPKHFAIKKKTTQPSWRRSNLLARKC